MVPVAASQVHQGVVKGRSVCARNRNIVNTLPEMKNNKIGSRRIYLLSVIMPMSKMRKVEARKLAGNEFVRSHTVRKEKGTIALPMRVQPIRIPMILWSS
eukprot:TRINITY_DN51038_c0_g1_i1.p2 TRINITY_DN51038_c0_g1~~TRINITY_DN51038_c0_g1_i1.p2  ORF type:complete len:100 (-),score=11.37 TRINITY_DN51038_c0_g1_i1:71-370(-)